jgi:CubicO group peptidase (beta-lactamase class C family)
MTRSLVLGLFMLLALAFTALPGAAAPSNAPDFAAIDRYIEVQMQAARLPGLALGIVQGDQIVHLRGFGLADPSGRTVTPQTPFILGSVSKPLTALAVMQLVEAGKIELDAPVQRYLAWFRVADANASARITVRHLLYHTSGMPEIPIRLRL